MREDEQEEARLWEKVASPDGDTKVDALLQLSYNIERKSIATYWCPRRELNLRPTA